jgi:hypothetical protein
MMILTGLFGHGAADWATAFSVGQAHVTAANAPSRIERL